MKQVFKGSEPASFKRWKEQETLNWKPVYGVLQNPQKRELHESLLSEQHYCCCYCGREIDAHTSHIEHFRPQETFEHLALEYNNLHASCLRETKPGNPLHCGHNKGNWFDTGLNISPLEDGCESRFSYLLSGAIQAANKTDAPASTMISVLALDIAYLNNRRREAVLGMFDEDFIEHATAAEFQTIADVMRTTERHSTRFSHVIARFAEQQLPH